MKVKKDKETTIYHFHNANPKGKNASDCVVRAVSVALGQSWEQTLREMTELGIKHGLVFNEPKCYEIYLKEKGFFKYQEPRDLNNKKILSIDNIDAKINLLSLIKGNIHIETILFIYNFIVCHLSVIDNICLHSVTHRNLAL